MIKAGYSFDPKLNLHTMIVVWSEIAGIFVDQDEPDCATILFKSGYPVRLNMKRESVKTLQDKFSEYLTTTTTNGEGER